MANEMISLEKMSANLASQTTDWIQKDIAVGKISTPKGYDVGTEITQALFQIAQTKDKNGQSALNVCTRESVMSSLRDMAIQGLSLTRKQCYAIVYGNQLQIQRSYFGTVAVFSRMFPNLAVSANVIYDGDEFEYGYDDVYDFDYIKVISSKLENRDNPIKAAYGFITERATRTKVFGCVMTMREIQKSWSKSRNKGLEVHKEFPQEMAKRTLLNRMCKMYVNTATTLDPSLADAYNRTTANEYDEETEPTVEEISIQKAIRSKSQGEAGLQAILAKKEEATVVQDARETPANAPIEQRQESIPTKAENASTAQDLRPSDISAEEMDSLFSEDELPIEEEHSSGYGDIPW